MASFIRRVPTAPGPRAVAIVHKQKRQVVGIEHIRSAHDDAALALLLDISRQRLHEGQVVHELGLPSSRDRRPGRCQGLAWRVCRARCCGTCSLRRTAGWGSTLSRRSAVRMLRPQRSVTIEVDGQAITAETAEIFNALRRGD